MISYGIFSPKHWDATRRAIADGACEDDDSFEFLNFQVEQWRKKALEGLDFIHPKDSENLDIQRLPESMPTLLYLRANQLRGLLLRPFFMSNSNLEASSRLAGPGLELALDTIHVLSNINNRTDIYRKQLPLFRHFLASSVALILLIIAHKVQNYSISYSDLWTQFLPSHINEGITRAVDLATAYAHSSTVSHRLWEQLTSMLEPISSLDIISRKRLRHQAVDSSFISDQTAEDSLILRRTPTEGASTSDLIQTSTLLPLPESTLLPYSATDNEFATSLSAQELSDIMENNDPGYLAADINIETLDGQEWYPESWELD